MCHPVAGTGLGPALLGSYSSGVDSEQGWDRGAQEGSLAWELGPVRAS